MLFMHYFAGSFLLTDGWPITRCNMWAFGVLIMHWRHLPCSGGWSSDWDALHNQREARELNHKRRSNWVFQFYHPKPWRFLWGRIAWLGSSPKSLPQFALFNSNCKSPCWGGSLCIESWRLEVCGKSVQTASQQETSAYLPVLFTPLENLGCLLYPGCLAKV